MSSKLKDNVNEFNRDVTDNGGYRYTHNATYSSIVSNKRLTEKIEQIIESIAGIKTILDIGCGDGTYTGKLKQRFPQIEFTGFDPATEAIDIAIKNNPDCNFLVGNVLDEKSFPDKKYDLVLFRGVIHHLQSQSAAIKNASLLSDRILIIEPNGNNPILKWIEKNNEYHVKHEEQSFSSRFLTQICIENKMHIHHLSFIGFVPFFFPTVPAKVIHFFQPLLEKIPLLPKFFGGQIVILANKNKN